MDWLRENWLWLFFFLVFIGMHVGHGQGMHGGRAMRGARDGVSRGGDDRDGGQGGPPGSRPADSSQSDSHAER